MAVVELKCKERTVLTAEYDYDIHAFLKIENFQDERLAPFGARDGSGSVIRRKLQSWWRDRSIPVTRDNYAHLRQALGDIDVIVLLEESYGLSLSDQYWLKRADDDTTWAQVNYFDNDFDGALGLLTLGSLDSQFCADSGLSPRGIGPSSTVGGNLRKSWEIVDGVRVLVKAGSAPFEQEPYNEAVASALYSRVLDGGDFVPYHVIERGRHPYSVCPCMVSKDECLVPAWEIINAYKRLGHESSWMHLLSCCKRLGVPDAERQLTKMFALDFVIANCDRHWNNLGVIFDADTMEAKRIAPIYDTGGSLWFDQAVLRVPADFLYRPLPLIQERVRRIRPEDQLALLKDFSWFDSALLQGFEEEARAILAGNSRLDSERLDAIASQMKANIRMLDSAAARAMA